MKPVRTLVVLANEGTVRFLENEGVGKGVTEIATYDADAERIAETEFADQPGRSRGAPGQARHGYAPPESEREHARALFADRVLAELRSAWNAGVHDRLVIAAPPKMLGELRARLDTLSDHVTAELDKDLVKIPLRDLPGHFSDVAAF